jgi:hypothetical protein
MITNPHSDTNPAFEVVSIHEMAEVRRNVQTGQNSLVATLEFKPGDTVSPFKAHAILKHPTYLTVQTGDDEHITLYPEFLQYVNHSCRPNVFFDTTHFKLVALRPIEPGDELCFFYPSAEWNMAQPFSCYCGHDNCLGEIRGAAWLSETMLTKYRFTDFIKTQLQKRQQAERA